MSFINLKARYTNGELSSNKIYDLLDKNIFKKFLSGSLENHGKHRSQNINLRHFKHIKQESLKSHVKNQKLFHMKNKKELLYEVYIKGIVESLGKFISERWDDNAKNVVLHTSGYDSRILSYFLKSVNKNKNNIVFVCLGPEKNHFKDIIEYQGWNSDNYITIDYDDQYYEENLSFCNAYKYLNGISFHPINNLNYIERKVKQMKFTGPFTMWTMGFFNEMFKNMLPISNECKKPLISVFEENFYRSRYIQFISSVNSNVVYPLLNEYTLKFLSLYGANYDYMNIRQDLVKYLDKKLYKFERTDDKFCNKIYRKTDIPEQVFMKAKNDYLSSSYGKIFKNKFSGKYRKVFNSIQWSFWTKASLLNILEHNGR